MSVYFIRSEDLIKIGYSTNVEGRVRGVINSLRAGGEYIGHIPGGRALEKHLHSVFANDREYGEWFVSSDRLSNFIETAAFKEFPGTEPDDPTEKLMGTEGHFADECAQFMRNFFTHLSPKPEYFARLSVMSGISNARLEAIYHRVGGPVTCGEYIFIEKMQRQIEEDEDAATAKRFRDLDRPGNQRDG